MNTQLLRAIDLLFSFWPLLACFGKQLEIGGQSEVSYLLLFWWRLL
jgi:hypothetical protein